MKIIQSILIVLSSALIASCSQSKDVHLKYPELLRSSGELESKDGKYIAEIKTIDDIVHIKIREVTSGDILIQGKSGNVFHRWYLCWDSQDRLWNWNSDIGGDVFEMKDGDWIRINNPDYTEAPASFIDELPSSMKRTLETKE